MFRSLPQSGQSTGLLKVILLRFSGEETGGFAVGRGKDRLESGSRASVRSWWKTSNRWVFFGFLNDKCLAKYLILLYLLYGEPTTSEPLEREKKPSLCGFDFGAAEVFLVEWMLG